MKIVIHDYAGHPFQFDLSKKLANMGFDVTHIYTTSSGGPKAGFKSYKHLEVIDIQVNKIDKAKFLKRRNQEKKYGDILVKNIERIKPDIVVSANTPLDAQKKLSEFCVKHNIHFIFWLQDIISIAMRSILKKKIGFVGDIITNYYRSIEIQAITISSHIIVIAEDFKDVVIAWGIEDDKVTTLPNWAPIEELPVLPKVNEFSKSYDLDDKFVVLYSGTLGMKHNPEIIIKAAKELKLENNIHFVVVSEGQGMDYLQKVQITEKIDNLLLLPFQPFEKLPEVLASADCILALLEPEAGIFSVPSKVWSAYCAERPSLLVMPSENLAAKITKAINAGFIIDNTNSIDNLTSKIIELKYDNDLKTKMGKNARKYAVENFQINTIAKKFEKIFLSLDSKL